MDLLTFDSPTQRESGRAGPAPKAATCLTFDSWGRCQPWKISGQDSVALHGCLKEIYQKQYQNSISERNHQKPREHQHEQKNISVITIACGELCKKKPNYVYSSDSSLFPCGSSLHYCMWCVESKQFFLGSTAQVTKSLSSPFPNQQPNQQPTTNRQTSLGIFP